MKLKIYLSLITFIPIFCYCQINFSFKYNDFSLEYNPNNSITIIDSIKYNKTHSVNKLKPIVSEEFDTGFYQVQFIDGNHYNGYWIIALLELENSNGITNVIVHNARGFYSIDKENKLFKNVIPINTLKKRNNSRRNNRKNLKIIENDNRIKRYFNKRSKNVNLYYGNIPSDLFTNIFDDSRFVILESINQEKLFYELSKTNNSFPTIINDDNFTWFKTTWKNDFKRLNHFHNENILFDVSFPTDYIFKMEESTLKLSNPFFNYSSKEHFIKKLPYVINKSDTIQISKSHYIKNDSLYDSSTEVFNKSNGEVYSLSRNIKSKLLGFGNINPINTSNDIILNKFKVSGLNNIVFFNDEFFYGIKKKDSTSFFIHGDGFFKFEPTKSYFNCSFKNGLLNGPYRLIKKNVLKEVGFYKNGLKEGWINKFDFEGKIISRCYYKDGRIKKDSLNEFYEYKDIAIGVNETPYKKIVITQEGSTYTTQEQKNSFMVFQMYINKKYIDVIYNLNDEVLIYQNGNETIRYEVSPQENNSKITFHYKTIEEINLKKKYHIKCSAEPITGNRKPRGKIFIWKDKDEDVLALYKSGYYEDIYIDKNGTLRAKVCNDLDCLLLNTIEAVFKPINDILGTKSIGLSYDSKKGFGIILEIDNKKVNLSTNELFTHYNQPQYNIPYFENYLSSINNEKIKESLLNENTFILFKKFLDEKFNDDYSNNFNHTPEEIDRLIASIDIETEVNNFLNYYRDERTELANWKIDYRNRINFFIPQRGIPYYWSNIVTPTLTGTRRVDYNKDQGLLAERDKGWRLHMSVDYVTNVGETIFSPIEGEIIKIGYPEAKYSDDEDVKTITIRDKRGTDVQLIYLTPYKGLKAKKGKTPGTFIKLGQPIGISPDMRIRYKKTPRQFYRYSEKMVNHIHMRIKLKDGTYTDRGQLFIIE